MTQSDSSGEGLPEEEDAVRLAQAAFRLTRPPSPALAERLLAVREAALPRGESGGEDDRLDRAAFAVVDLETTGLGANAHIVEIGVRHIRGQRIQHRWQSLVKPDVEIPAEVTALTGLAMDDLEAAPSFSDVAPQLRALLDGRIFVAHNSAFDLSILAGAFARARLPQWEGLTLCTRRLAMRLRPDIRRRNLSALCAAFDIHHPRPHRAGPDAEATAHLLIELLRLAPAVGVETVGDLQELMDKPAARGADLSGYAFGPAFLDHLPREPGIYRMKDRLGNVIYVGKARDLHQRVRSYFSGRARGRVQLIREALHDIEIVRCDSEIEALLLEAAEIRTRRPALNVQVQIHRRAFFLRPAKRGRRRLVSTQQPDEDSIGPFFLSCGGREAARRVREALALSARKGSSSPDPETLLREGNGLVELCDLLETELRSRNANGDREGADRLRDILVTLRRLVAATGAPRTSFHRRDLLVRLPSRSAPRLFLLREGYPLAPLLAPDAGDPLDELTGQVRRLLAEPTPLRPPPESDDLKLLDSWLLGVGPSVAIELASFADEAELRDRVRAALESPSPPDSPLFK